MHINQIKLKSLAYLKNEQNSDGSFFCFVSQNPDDFDSAEDIKVIPNNALILSCLNNLDQPENSPLQEIKENLANFLTNNKSDFWSFNFWDRESASALENSRPDDLINTFCSLAALQKNNPDIIDGQALALIVAILTSVEAKEGGPYNTWVVSKEKISDWHEIDLAANSNIAYFLELNEVDLPNIVQLVEQAIETEKYNSSHFPTVWPVVYFISRFYQGNKKENLINFILKNKKENSGWENNPLDTAFALLALANLGYELNFLKNSIKYIIQNQKDGIWPAQAFCFDSVKNEKRIIASGALTTVLCLEILEKYSNSTQKENIDEAIDKKQLGIYEQIINETGKIFSDDLEKISLKFLDKMILGDKDKQVVLMPYYFFKNLKDKTKIDERIIIKLGVANLLGWTAYTIFDDFLDKEGDPKLLPTAIVSKRTLTEIYSELAEQNQDIKTLFKETMQKLDNANSWEVQNCRAKIENVIMQIPDQLPDYQDYSKLAERSLGHALGPVTILLLQGYDKNSDELKNLLEFFKHYIIAKQLNDDSTDWEEDIKKGQLNSACALLLAAWQKKTGKKQINLKTQFTALQQIFWSETITQMCEQILNHVDLAKQALSKINILSDTQALENLLAPHENSAQKALKIQKETLKFIETYQKQ